MHIFRAFRHNAPRLPLLFAIGRHLAVHSPRTIRDGISYLYLVSRTRSHCPEVRARSGVCITGLYYITWPGSTGSSYALPPRVIARPGPTGGALADVYSTWRSWSRSCWNEASGRRHGSERASDPTSPGPRRDPTPVWTDPDVTTRAVCPNGPGA